MKYMRKNHSVTVIHRKVCAVRENQNKEKKKLRHRVFIVNRRRLIPNDRVMTTIHTIKTSWTFEMIDLTFARCRLFREFSLRVEPAGDSYIVEYVCRYIIFPRAIKMSVREIFDSALVDVALFNTCAFESSTRVSVPRRSSQDAGPEARARAIRIIRCVSNHLLCRSSRS